MMTKEKADRLLLPGEAVFCICQGEVREAHFIRALANSLLTDRGFLEYDDHRISWFLTRVVAEGVASGEIL